MPDGRNRIPWNISKHLQEMCVKAGIPPRSFHILRHTHATVLLSHGVHPKIVQERLGHSDIKITMEIYSHVTPTIQRAAVEVYENIGTAEAQSAEIVEGVFGHELIMAVI